MTVRDGLFCSLGVICAVAAICAVTTKHLVHAALWLTLALTALSGGYLVLGAELVGLVQLLVYVGAVVVLVLFSVMLTRAPIGRSNAHDMPMMTRLGALVISAATGGLMFSALTAAFTSGPVKVHAGTSTNLSSHLFGQFAWPLEVVSLVLLSAFVGALAMVGSHVRGARR